MLKRSFILVVLALSMILFMITVGLAQISNAQNSQTPTPETARLGYSEILEIHQPERVELLAWNPQQDILASSSGDMVSLWNVASGELLSSWQAVPLSLTVAMDWNPDGTLLATVDLDGIVQIWDADSGEMTLSFLAPLASDLNWSPDSRLLATANDTEDSSSTDEERVVNLWDSSTGERLQTQIEQEGGTQDNCACYGVAFSSDGRLIAGASFSVSISIRDITSGALIAHFYDDTSYHILGDFLFAQSIDWSDSRIIIVSNNNQQDIYAVQVWNSDTGELVAALPTEGDRSGVSAVDWHPDGRFIAASTYSGTVQIWDADTYKTLAVIQAHDDIITSMVWSPDGTSIASTGWDGIIRIWSLGFEGFSN